MCWSSFQFGPLLRAALYQKLMFLLTNIVDIEYDSVIFEAALVAAFAFQVLRSAQKRCYWSFCESFTPQFVKEPIYAFTI